MSIQQILTVPNEKLIIKCEKVKNVDAETQSIVQDLIQTLHAAKNPEGAGLAAPQIGVLKRICVVKRFIVDPKNPQKETSEDYVLINPKLISSSKETDLDWEGCLSIPNTYGRVIRPQRIKVKALNEQGDEVKIVASGFFARVIQHEMDHLDGVLFTTKIVGKTITESELDELGL